MATLNEALLPPSGMLSNTGYQQVLTAPEANSIAKTAIADQQIAIALAQVNAVSAFQPALSNSNSGAIQTLKQLDSTLLSKGITPQDAVLKGQIAVQLKVVIEREYFQQIQAIRSTASSGAFELIFDLTEQAKQDLTPFLKDKGYTLTEIPTSAISNVPISKGKMSPGSLATYEGRTIKYYSFGVGSTMILVHW